MVHFEEIECKFLEVDKNQLIAKLESVGATYKFKKLFRRYVFDYPDKRLNTENSWLRLRDEGNKITLAFKQRLEVTRGKNDVGMKEIEIVVSNFDKTAALCEAIGLVPKFYEENWRTAYELNGVEVVIDEWPLIPPYVEIEGKNWDVVDETAHNLGFNLEDKVVYSTMQVYENYGIDEMSYKTLTFDKQIKK